MAKDSRSQFDIVPGRTYRVKSGYDVYTPYFEYSTDDAVTVQEFEPKHLFSYETPLQEWWWWDFQAQEAEADYVPPAFIPSGATALVLSSAMTALIMLNTF